MRGHLEEERKEWVDRDFDDEEYCRWEKIDKRVINLMTRIERGRRMIERRRRRRIGG